MKFTLSEQKLTPQEFDTFEQKYNIKLPQAYRDVILAYNGGFPEKRYFNGGVVYFDPIKYGEDTIEMVIDTLPKEFLDDLAYFPFGMVSGRHLCIEINGGAIWYIDSSGEFDLIADSFEEFMERLSYTDGEDEDDEPLI